MRNKGGGREVVEWDGTRAEFQVSEIVELIDTDQIIEMDGYGIDLCTYS